MEQAALAKLSKNLIDNHPEVERIVIYRDELKQGASATISRTFLSSTQVLSW